LIQEFGQNVSGRAANMLQQAGLAELGPFLKLPDVEVYRSGGG